VIIFSPARSASQQGKALNGTWKIAFGNAERCAGADHLLRLLASRDALAPSLALTPALHSWENPLMGWCSTADPLAHVGRSALEFNRRASQPACLVRLPL
jgi:hypothetical protein